MLPTANLRRKKCWDYKQLQGWQNLRLHSCAPEFWNLQLLTFATKVSNIWPDFAYNVGWCKKSEKYGSLEPTNFETEILELTNYLRENQQKFNILKSKCCQFLQTSYMFLRSFRSFQKGTASLDRPKGCKIAVLQT